jgi:glycosyltransferase involved in cell wall biosynthesis
VENNLQPLVTIITVTYNSAKYVRDAIEGVLVQTYSNLEYIIADDCSTDNTWDIINEYTDDRIIKYKNEINLREYPNRNKAIDLAKGAYLIFIDGDDVMYPTAIEYLLWYATKFPEAALIIQKNYSNNILYPALVQPKQSFCNVYFGKKNLLNSSFTANFFNTSILKKTGGLSTQYKAGDDEVRLRIAFQHPILLIQGWVTWPRETPNQASSKIDTLTANKESIKLLNSLDKLHEDITEELIYEANQERLKTIAKQILFFIKRGNIKNAYQLSKEFKINIFTIKKKLAFEKSNKDEFENYLPESPYKKDFRELCYKNS